MLKRPDQQQHGCATPLYLVLVAIVPMVARSQSTFTPFQGLTLEGKANLQTIEAVRRLHESGQTIAVETIRKQLERSSCQLSLPSTNSTRLTAQQIRQRAEKAYLRMGWVYQCIKCDQWHVTLAGGYALTTNGAVATCYHVVNPPRDLRTGALIAADRVGKVFPVMEVLAANRYADACIVQVKGDGFTPLPLNTNVTVGDTVYCFDNQGERDAFAQGVVTRFVKLPERRLENVRGAPLFVPLRIQVTATWELGSSGSALLDECGNAIGHASTLTFTNDSARNSHETPPPQSIFHEATSGKDIFSLVQTAK